MRVLGIDYGSKHLGLALSDPEGRLARPHGVVANSNLVIAELAELCQREEVGLIVMGEPLRLNREPNALLKPAQAFADRLIRATQLSVFWEPEWFTTTEARRLQSSTKYERLDATAAYLILTNYLEKQKHQHHV